jgi:hypothetical protein
MLSALSSGESPYYEGNAAGVTDEKTTKAIKAFQKANGLKIDGKAGPQTLKALVSAYMDLEDTSLEEGIEPLTHGCAGHFDDTVTEAGLQPDDRRLEVFFFDKEIDPVPAGQTSLEGSTDYPAWCSALVETHDFEHHGIHIQIVDAHKQPIGLAEVHLEGPTTDDAVADEHGYVSFFGLLAGEYTVSATLEGKPVANYKITYPTARTVTGHQKKGKSASKTGPKP